MGLHQDCSLKLEVKSSRARAASAPRRCRLHHADLAASARQLSSAGLCASLMRLQKHKRCSQHHRSSPRCDKQEREACRESQVFQVALHTPANANACSFGAQDTRTQATKSGHCITAFILAPYVFWRAR